MLYAPAAFYWKATWAGQLDGDIRWLETCTHVHKKALYPLDSVRIKDSIPVALPLLVNPKHHILTAKANPWGDWLRNNRASVLDHR